MPRRGNIDAHINPFLIAQHHQQVWFDFHHQQITLELRHQRRLLIWLLLQQREQRAIDLFNAIVTLHEQTGGDHRLEWRTGSNGRRQLNWFLPLLGPGAGLGGADDPLREFRGGFIPRHVGGEVSGPLPLPIEDVSRGGGEEVVEQGEVGGESGQEVGELPVGGGGPGEDRGEDNPFDFEVRR
jgi:hypothetical protein